MNLNLEQCLTVVACLGCTVSITAMIAIARQSDIAPQRISISLGLPVVEAGTATQLEVTTVALEPLQQSDLTEVSWFQSLDPTVMSQRSAPSEELFLLGITREAELATCLNVYNPKLMPAAACELKVPTSTAPTIATASTHFPTPTQLLGTTPLGSKSKEYQ
jgi:hypothetical protein